ncbi:MAG: 2,3-bisphosphoglycerate-independent phosphoglycerate mutase [Methanobacteriota archaeon]
MPEHGKMMMVICDGMGDRPCVELGGMTPLQRAEAPFMDSLARKGMSGLMHTVGVGRVPGSDTAHLALLGYDPETTYTGRGPFEAMGAGVEVKPGDVAFRCNFATVENGIVKDRRAGRIREGTEKLAAALDGMKLGGAEVIFRAGVEHRAILLLRGAGLSSKITDTDPHAEGVAILASKATSKEGEKTAKALNEFTKRSIDALAKFDSPANAVLVRGGGLVPHVQKFSERYNMKGSAVVGITLVKGICNFAGLDAVNVKGATGSVDTDYDAKAMAAAKALDGHDFVLLHYKAPDIYGHDANPQGKVDVIERIDSALGKAFKGRDDAVIALTADHSTPCSAKDHTADPVPLVISAPWLRKDRVECFDEISAAEGALGNIQGKDLLAMMMGYANRAEKFGA